jgi:integrase
LIDCLPERYRVYGVLGAFAGLRHAEIAGLRRADIVPMHSTIRVRRSLEELDGKVKIVDDLKTPQSRRDVVVPKTVMDQLTAHLAAFVDTDSDAPIVTDDKGRLLTRNHFRRSVWLPAVAEARRRSPEFPRGRVTPHSLRHSHAALLIECGTSIKEVSERLGHANAAITLKVYAKVYASAQARTAERLDAVLSADVSSNVIAMR